MLRALMEKVDRMWKQMSNASRVMETLRQNQEEMLENKQTNEHLTEMKTALMNSVVDWTCPGKEWRRLATC